MPQLLLTAFKFCPSPRPHHLAGRHHGKAAHLTPSATQTAKSITVQSATQTAKLAKLHSQLRWPLSCCCPPAALCCTTDSTHRSLSQASKLHPLLLLFSSNCAHLPANHTSVVQPLLHTPLQHLHLPRPSQRLRPLLLHFQQLSCSHLLLLLLLLLNLLLLLPTLLFIFAIFASC
jgi:hypothetical protein